MFITALMLFSSSIFASDLLLEHSPQPLQAEATMEALQPWETPLSGFFIRSHHGVPRITEESWALQIDGLVETPITLKLKDLQKMKLQSQHAVLECSGNSRAFQLPQAPGVQWTRGALGNAEWTGTSLAEILSQVKIKKNARFVRVEGADYPILPSVPGFIRSIPLSRILQKDTLLAWGMNREPLTLLHGGPVRLILPGWYGENWLKWITHITLTEKEEDSFYMKKGYRIPQKPLSSEKSWDPAEGTPIERILVQSLIVSPLPGETVTTGAITVSGKAFSGNRAITQVEISKDLGKTWQIAALESPHPTGGWQEFHTRILIPAPGRFSLISRAQDNAGDIQPLRHSWNPGGYLRNSADPLTFSAARQAYPTGETVLQQKCLTCHARELIESQRLSLKQWRSEIKKMKEFGVKLSPEEEKSLLKYFEKLNPNRIKNDPILTRYEIKNDLLKIKKETLTGNTKNGETLFMNNCVQCHGTHEQAQVGPRLLGRVIPQADFWSTLLYGKRGMPAFSVILKNKEISDIYSYINMNF